jgi:transglutaminase-like putative cysteine protease
MLYKTTHITRYDYERQVAQCLNEAYITPRNLPYQTVHEFRLVIDPKPALLERRKDYFGNDVVSFSTFTNHDHFSATATSLVDVEPRPQKEVPRIAWEAARDRVAAYPDLECLQALEFVFDSPFVKTAPELTGFAIPSFPPTRPLFDAVSELSHRINKEFKYQPKSTSIRMPLIEAFHNRRGVCQDFSHIMIGALRSLRLPARYVSGYLRSGAVVQGGTEASHAWVSVFIPGAGWLDFDPTNDVMPSEGHVTVAWGRDYGDVTPVKGIALGGGKQTVDVDVRVEPAKSL